MTGISVSEIKQLIIIPTLKYMPLKYTSPAAINLLAGTALVESSDEYLEQVGGGPALSLWQIEPATEQDCWTNFLTFNPEVAASITHMLAINPPRTQQLISNLFYACAMARIKYYRAPDPLPAFDDAIGLANYHKNFYNTSLGATVVAQSKVLFQQAIEA